MKISRQGLRELSGLLRYVRPYWVPFALGLLCLALGSQITLGFSVVLGKLVDAGLTQSRLDIGPEWTRGVDVTLHRLLPTDLDDLALVLIGMLALQAGLSFFRIRLFVSVTERTLADLRQDLFSRLIRLPMGFFTQRRVGELQSRIGSDIGQIGDTLTYTLAEMLRGLLMLLVGLSMIVIISPKLTLVMLSSFPLVIVASIFFGRKIRKLSRAAQDKLAEANVVVEESLQGIQNVKSFTNESFEAGRYQRAIQEVVGASLQSGSWRAGFAAFIITALFGSIVLVLWYGSGQVQQGLLSVGALTTFFILTMMVGASMAGFGEQFAQIQRALGATERVRELLVEVPEVEVVNASVGGEGGPGGDAEGVGSAQPSSRRSRPAGAELPRANGAVAFEQVAFTYPSRPETPVLADVSFKVEAGQRVALVGSSGAGKSTIISLLQRFYEPSQGRILLDGQNIAQQPLSWLRAQMAIVPQEVLLFGGSIRENLRYGKHDATDAELERAAERANALEFIQRFPEGLDTIVGERGIKLSGGQRQRIAIARAILRDPAILLLDEATSSLDAESESLVQQALDQLMIGRTTVVVAHRLATVRTADLIVVLDRGQIVEQGGHDELMQRPNGVYRGFASLQYLDGGERVLR